MKRIEITRDAAGNVNFQTVAVIATDTVFFINLDPLEEHFPTIAANKLGKAPSPPSSQCFPQASYGCNLHSNEHGTIQIVPALAPVNTNLSNATKGQPIVEQQVIKGGLSPYQITGAVFQITGPNNTVLQKGSGPGPGLQLNPKPNNNGVSVSGTPTVSGTYTFTFVVNDAMGGNLQQIQYTMIVV
jgi:hypothetical protein